MNGCPHCGALRVERDYAPPRTYALLLLGIGLLFAGRFVRPELLLWGPGEIGRLVGLGAVISLFGLYDAFRHANVYCHACGTRFRRTGGPQASACAAPAAGERPSPARSAPLPGNTPIEPLLACLKFKNDRMRAEAVASLRELTGEDFGEDAEAWNAWWAANRESHRARKRANP